MGRINTIISDICAGIKADQTIGTWSAANYARSCMVYENCDPRNAPGHADCPLVIVYPLSKRTGLSVTDRPHAIGVACWVFDSETPESIEGVTRFSGGRMVEELRELVLAAIVGVLPGSNMQLSVVDTEYSTLMEFPLVEARMTLEFTEPWTIGSSAYE